MEAQQKPQPQKAAPKAGKAAKKIEPAPDFFLLTSFRDALLELKAAVETGVDRQDY